MVALPLPTFPYAAARSLLFRWAAATGMVLSVASCSDGASEPRIPGGTLEQRFLQQDVVVLHQEPGDLIGDVGAFLELLSGDLLVADRYRPRIRRYQAGGALGPTWGTFGSGPFEVRRLVDVAELADGRIVAADAGLARLSVLTAALEPDTLFQLQRPVFLIHSFGEGLLRGMHSGRGSQPVFEFVDISTDSLLWAFHDLPREVWTAPYLSSIVKTYMAAKGGEVFVATSLFYPIMRYEGPGRSNGVLGTPPPSFVRVDPVKPGAFPGGVLSPGLADWLSSFTIIGGLYVLEDSLMVVAHSRYKPVARDPLATEQYAFDVYRLPEGQKVLADVQLPPGTRVVGGGSFLYTLDSVDEIRKGYTIRKWSSRFSP